MTTPMGSNIPGDVTSDDKLWALLAYALSPIVPVIVLFMQDKRDRPFIKAHNAQALIWGLVNFIGGSVVGVFCFCIPTLIIWGVGVYWGFQAYNGKLVTIPLITDFVKSQGWA